MRTVLLLFIMIFANAPIKAQKLETSFKGDSLVITGPELTANSFGFGADPLANLSSYKGKLVHHKTVQNRHIPDQVDTLFHINIGHNHFEIYKAASKNFLSKAHIESDDFETTHGIEVGMSKQQFLELMNIPEIDSIPDNVRLENKIAPQYIDLCFQNDRIEYIRFTGYVD